jgi:acid phosphatase
MCPTWRARRAAATPVLALALLTVACQSARTTSDRATSTTGTTIAPHPSNADSGFIAFGDAGEVTLPTQDQVARQMQTWVAAGHRVDALVEAGDDVYPDGDPSLFAAALDTPYAGLRSSTRPLWVALGNHDVRAGHGAEQLTYLGLPPLPYARTLTGVQILFLDANHPDRAQATWLDARLSEAGPALRVVVFHQPAYSCALHGSTAAVDKLWVPILETHHVALVLNGHDHYYERFTSAKDVTYVVTGGGGAALYTRVPCAAGVPRSQATATRHHFVGIEIRGSTLSLTAVAPTGEVLDTATITR